MLTYLPFLSSAKRFSIQLIKIVCIDAGLAQHKVGSYGEAGSSKSQTDKRNELYLIPLLLEQLRAIGYQVSFAKLQAAQYGVPQERRRFALLL